MADDRQKKLDALLKKRDGLRDSVQRIKGRLDSARQDLKGVEEECIRRKVPPDQLEESIRRLEEKFNTAVVEIQGRIDAAEAAISPYLKEEGNEVSGS